MKSLHKLITILLFSCSLGTFAYEQEHPTGVLMAKSTNPGQQRYKYNGKEFEPLHGLNWNDYGARWYDPATSLFTTIDPLCEKYYHIYPYAYCAGNPVNRVDPEPKHISRIMETYSYLFYLIP